jgi:uncharacterized protein (DUF2267 family)
MAANNAGEFENQSEPKELLAGDSSKLSQELSELLLEVLRETDGRGSRQDLELLTEVARKSKIEHGDDPAAIREVVLAIVDDRFGVGRFTERLVGRISETLAEIPEASRRLAKIWREARRA